MAKKQVDQKVKTVEKKQIKVIPKGNKNKKVEKKEKSKKIKKAVSKKGSK